MSHPHIDLLLTDSLDRPLGGARYSVHRSARPSADNRLREGTLDGRGRLSLPWHDEGLTLCVGFRALVLSRSAPEGRIRDRLSCLGLGTGGPHRPIEPARVERALGALLDDACARGLCTPGGDPHELLERWVRGEVGVGEPAVPGAARTRRWRRRGPRHTASAAGSHTYPLAPEAFDVPRRHVRLAVAVGPRGSAEAANRIVVYDWFAGFGPPPCDGNVIDALIDGEDAWGAVARDIAAAGSELCVTTWWADPDIELTRPLELAGLPAQHRDAHRLAAYVEALADRGGRTMILVWSWLGTPILQRTLRRWATEAGDHVEVQQRGHPGLIGSFHHKTMVIDRRVAYCGGFNLRQNDWDTQAHALDDPRRKPHGPPRDRTPAYPPRHDVSARIEGPLVGQLHDAFAAYWNATVDAREARRGLWARAVDRVNGAGPSDRVRGMRASRPLERGSMLAQVVQTEPHRHPREQPIYDVLRRAIHNAHKLVYIENQFFRSQQITEALVSSLRRHPALELVVVTNPVRGALTFAWGGAYYTALAQARIREVRPEFTLHCLLAHAERGGVARYAPIELHAKVMIVDDEWCTIGSANLNERSILSEAEANVAVEDDTLAAGLRRRLMAEHLGIAPDDERIASPRDAALTFRALALDNARARAKGQLARGHAHPFEQQRSWRLLRGRPEWF